MKQTCSCSDLYILYLPINILLLEGVREHSQGVLVQGLQEPKLILREVPELKTELVFWFRPSARPNCPFIHAATETA